VRVAERLQHRDLIALCGDQARQDDVEQEGGDGEEDGRQNGAEDLVLGDLVGQEAVRDPPRMLSSVDLPLPEGPSMTTNSPRQRSRSTSRRAYTSTSPMR